ncbi:hypothetical protein GCM10028817_28720 [Spirosoma pomorum]
MGSQFWVRFILTTNMDKLDLAKQFPSYYKATTKPELITLPPANYLAISGQGAPESDEYGQKLQALYSVAYGLKFLAKGPAAGLRRR